VGTDVFVIGSAAEGIFICRGKPYNVRARQGPREKIVPRLLLTSVQSLNQVLDGLLDELAKLSLDKAALSN
jgi:hypothetical protein